MGMVAEGLGRPRQWLGRVRLGLGRVGGVTVGKGREMCGWIRGMCVGSDLWRLRQWIG